MKHSLRLLVAAAAALIATVSATAASAANLAAVSIKLVEPRRERLEMGKTLVAILALVASLLVLAAPASADNIDSAIAHGWAGAGCASPSPLSQLVDSTLAANPDAVSVQAGVFSPRCGFFQDAAGLRDVASNWGRPRQVVSRSLARSRMVSAVRSARARFGRFSGFGRVREEGRVVNPATTHFGSMRVPARSV
jgi:hypothetical protein